MLLKLNVQNLSKFSNELLCFTNKTEKDLIGLFLELKKYIDEGETSDKLLGRFADLMNSDTDEMGVNEATVKFVDMYGAYNATILIYKEKWYIGDWGGILEHG